MTEKKGLLEEFTEQDFEELDITDDFLFYSTLSRNMELCRELLEIILDQKIRKVKLVQVQKGRRLQSVAEKLYHICLYI